MALLNMTDFNYIQRPQTDDFRKGHDDIKWDDKETCEPIPKLSDVPKLIYKELIEWQDKQFETILDNIHKEHDNN